MKLLVLLSIIPTICMASSWEEERAKKQEENTQAISRLKPYSCFEEIGLIKANLPWDKTYISHSKPYVVITSNSDGILYLQPNNPMCEDDPAVKQCKSYWLRSWKWKDFGALGDYRPVACPKFLNQAFVKAYLRKYYANQLFLSKLP